MNAVCSSALGSYHPRSAFYQDLQDIQSYFSANHLCFRVLFPRNATSRSQLTLNVLVTMMSFNAFFFAALSGVLFVLLRWIRQLGRLPKGLPPGPPTIPILGNLHQLSLETGHKQMKAWASQYGSMYTLMMGPRHPVIVVSSEKHVKALLVKRGSNFSSRPDHYMAHEVLSGGLRVIFMVRIPFNVPFAKLRSTNNWLILVWYGKEIFMASQTCSDACTQSAGRRCCQNDLLVLSISGE